MFFSTKKPFTFNRLPFGMSNAPIEEARVHTFGPATSAAQFGNGKFPYRRSKDSTSLRLAAMRTIIFTSSLCCFAGDLSIMPFYPCASFCCCCRSDSKNSAASPSLQFLRSAMSLIACSGVSVVRAGAEYGFFLIMLKYDLRDFLPRRRLFHTFR